MILGTLRRRPYRAVTLLATGVAAAAVLVACSSNSGNTSATTPASSTPATSGSGTPATSGGGASATSEGGTSSAAPTFKDGGTLTVGLTGTSFGPLDPTTANTLPSVSVLATMCEGLYISHVGETTLTPVLATGQPTYSSDRTSATVKIRSGVKFQDGTTMDAQAVKETFDRNLTLSTSQRKGDLVIIKSVDVVDPTTLKFNFKGVATDGAFANAFSSRAVLPVSPTAVKNEGANFATNPVCVGPYKFSSQGSDTVTLTRDSNYYDPSSAHLDSVVFKLVADPSVRLANLESGQFNVIQSPSPKDLATLQGNSKLTVLNADGIGFQDLMINTKGALSNALVRKALEESIDRDAIAKAVWNGTYPTACTFMPQQNPLATPANTACVPHDVAQAKKDIAASGVPTPINATLIYANQPEWQQTAALVQSFAKEIGINLTLDPSDTQSVTAATSSGKFDISINQWTGTIDPVGNIQLTKGGFSNYTGWDTTAMDQLVATINATTDSAKLKDLYAQAVTLIQDQTPVIYLVRPKNLQTWQSNVAGVWITPSSSMSLMHAGFTS